MANETYTAEEFSPFTAAEAREELARYEADQLALFGESQNADAYLQSRGEPTGNTDAVTQHYRSYHGRMIATLRAYADLLDREAKLRSALTFAMGYVPTHDRGCMRDPELGCSCGLPDFREHVRFLTPNTTGD